MSEKLAKHAFTKKHTVLTNVICTPISISTPSDTNFCETNGIWDTGATNTVITQKVVDFLSLKPTGMTNVNTASETNKPTYTYLIDVYFKDMGLRVPLTVTLGVITDSIDCLIGMDIICLGDFSVTHHKGETAMSFRIPSLHCIDYVKEHKIASIKQTKGFRK